MESYVKQRKYFSEIKTGYKFGSPKEKPFGKPEIMGLKYLDHHQTDAYKARPP